MRIVVLSLLAAMSATPAAAKCGFFAPTSCFDDQYCRSIGAQPGTDTYVQCRLMQQQLHVQQSQNFNQMYQNLMPMIVQPAPPAPAPPTRCTSRWYGAQLQTTCF